MRTIPRLAAAALAVAVAVPLAACGDDADDGAARATTTTTRRPETVAVTAVDYRYEGLPEEIASGTKLTLRSGSTDELHEMVVFRLPDSERRSVAELMALPESEQDQIATGEPATVLLVPPGSSEEIQAVGDGTITEPGRYVVLCSIPQGADPQAYLDAPEGDGPPQVDGGPPHFTMGMFAELHVR